MDNHFFNRRAADDHKCECPEKNSMVRTRLLLGTLALSHSVSALILPEKSAIFILSNVWHLSFWLPVLLGALAGMMIIAALAEYLGYSQRAAHEFSAAMLAVMWIVIWAYSFMEGADYITFLAPVHIFFIGWSVIAEAQVQREKVTMPVILIKE